MKTQNDLMPEDEAAVLNFLKEHASTKFTTEEIGRAVRPLVMKADPGGDKLIVRNWASVRLRSLLRRHLIQKEGTGSCGKQSNWWADA